MLFHLQPSFMLHEVTASKMEYGLKRQLLTSAVASCFLGVGFVGGGHGHAGTTICYITSKSTRRLKNVAIRSHALQNGAKIVVHAE